MLEIGQVIKVITSIAQQTASLALNATIEAARVWPHDGKGFAVVANEVKELAKQTARATDDIRAKIEAIQADTKGSVEAISTISSIINQVNDFSTIISSSVDEQTTTTGSIAVNISEGARGSSEIAQNISGVAQAALSTSTERVNSAPRLSNSNGCLPNCFPSSDSSNIHRIRARFRRAVREQRIGYQC